jgi:hypothetical protein
MRELLQAEAPKSISYSRAMSGDIVRIAFDIAALLTSCFYDRRFETLMRRYNLWTDRFADRCRAKRISQMR